MRFPVSCATHAHREKEGGFCSPRDAVRTGSFSRSPPAKKRPFCGLRDRGCSLEALLLPTWGTGLLENHRVFTHGTNRSRNVLSRTRSNGGFRQKERERQREMRLFFFSYKLFTTETPQIIFCFPQFLKFFLRACALIARILSEDRLKYDVLNRCSEWPNVSIFIIIIIIIIIISCQFIVGPNARVHCLVRVLYVDAFRFAIGNL